ncbi:Protein of unknown function DUF616 [Dillenia turbinata]|uniref:TOD1/MUCI70 glycosyltransferase-like domain-containing protein n=1 Tax=Dillenia turbinata TaxID=194707 RepID=A0AAN8W448_9MAGN
MSASMLSGISIPFSDDDSDVGAGKMRGRVRRKRKKPVGIPGPSLLQRIIRGLVKWWPLLLFLPALGLFVYEAFKVGRTPVTSTISRHDWGKKSNLVDQRTSNLNRLDPTTKIIGGARQPCLKLLPPEELEHLDIPLGDDPSSPVKSVVYLSENDSSYGLGNTQQHSQDTRFNLFTGHQSFNQRDKSFEVKETAAVHCGFFSENGGFKISEEDKSYMKTCKVVVSTCAFGGGDNLYQPIGMSEASLKKVCYVAFWDEITLSIQESGGNKVGEDHYIGNWRKIVVRELPFSDQRLNGKIPKMLAHRLFPHARYSIWVDAKSQFRRDPLSVLEALLWRSNSVLGISEHGARSSVYDEAKAVVHKNKATPEEVEVQLTQYRLDGLPEDKRFNGKKALAEASIILRKHTPLSNLFMCVWFNEVVRFTSRDQLSFPYVLWRLKALSNINMFPVCTRKDLVNSMGHVRKAKPLIG